MADIHRHLISIAKRIYVETPFESFRRFYFRLFCAVIRNKTVSASVDGITYRLDLGETIDLALYLNRYEPDLTAALEGLCRPGSTVLDIGANVGAHTLRIARIVGQSGKVYAFEPTDCAFGKLIRNISLNGFGNIVPLQIALSDRNLSKQSIWFRSSWPTKGRQVERKSVVDFVRLDDWSEGHNLSRVDMIKLDVDGNEYPVIMGARSLLSRHRPLILMEVWGPNFADPLRNPYDLLKNLGYRFFNIDNGEEFLTVDHLRVLVSSEEGDLLDYSVNIIAR